MIETTLVAHIRYVFSSSGVNRPWFAPSLRGPKPLTASLWSASKSVPTLLNVCKYSESQPQNTYKRTRYSSSSKRSRTVPHNGFTRSSTWEDSGGDYTGRSVHTLCVGRQAWWLTNNGDDMGAGKWPCTFYYVRIVQTSSTPYGDKKPKPFVKAQTQACLLHE